MEQRSSFKVLGLEGDASMLHIRWFDLQQQYQNPVLKGRKPARLFVLPGRKCIPTMQVGTQVKPGWTTLNCRDQRPVFMYLLLSCYQTELSTLWSCTEDIFFQISCVWARKWELVSMKCDSQMALWIALSAVPDGWLEYIWDGEL